MSELLQMTEALLFLSHFMGDVHQPLLVGFSSNRGGNTIDVHWYRRKTELHHVWDVNIIETSEKDYYDDGTAEFIDALNKNITGEWSGQVQGWEECGKNLTACPDIYATEGITTACDWAYKNVTEDSTLSDDYFDSRLPIVNLRLAQGGVRLAATDGERAAAVGGGPAEGGSGDEPGGVDVGDAAATAEGVAEEAQHGRRPVERAVAAEEAGVGEDAAPGLAGEGGALEARRVVRREAEEDLGDQVVDQLRQRRAGMPSRQG